MGTEAPTPGSLLEDALARRGITRLAFAKMLGVRVNWVSRVINGKRRPSTERQFQIQVFFPECPMPIWARARRVEPRKDAA